MLRAAGGWISSQKKNCAWIVSFYKQISCGICGQEWMDRMVKVIVMIEKLI